jgi:outer membrane murein-binding lipoprotein Lpp
MPDQPTARPLTLAEAAATLGISREAVRLRVRRGTLHGERGPAGWLVYLTNQDDQPPDRPTTRTNDQATSSVAVLRAQVAALTNERNWLRNEVERQHHDLERAQVAEGELRRLLQQAQQPRLLAPVAATATPVDTSNFARSGESDGDQRQGESDHPRRWWAWWRR